MAIADITHLPPRSRPPRRSLRSWLRDVRREMGLAFERAGALEHPAEVEVGEATAVAASVAPEETVMPPDSAVLPFPIRGEALLVRLATALRARFGERGPEDDPLQFAISRDPQLRLTIDRAAYIEFQQHERAFRLAVEANPDTTLSLETSDIDIIVGFVTRYIGEKLGEPTKFEVAS